MSFLILPLLLLAMWFLVIRPQQQRIRAQQALVAALEEGDEVVSSSGIYGRITSLTDEIATLEVADGVELRVARGAIARRLPPDDEYPDDTYADAESDADDELDEDDAVIDVDGHDLIEPEVVDADDEPGAGR
jgi:preprotein translocase subunit YajC